MDCISWRCVNTVESYLQRGGIQSPPLPLEEQGTERRVIQLWRMGQDNDNGLWNILLIWYIHCKWFINFNIMDYARMTQWISAIIGLWKLVVVSAQNMNLCFFFFQVYVPVLIWQHPATQINQSTQSTSNLVCLLLVHHKLIRIKNTHLGKVLQFCTKCANHYNICRDYSCYNWKDSVNILKG